MADPQRHRIDHRAVQQAGRVSGGELRAHRKAELVEAPGRGDLGEQVGAALGELADQAALGEGVQRRDGVHQLAAQDDHLGALLAGAQAVHGGGGAGDHDRRCEGLGEERRVEVEVEAAGDDRQRGRRRTAFAQVAPPVAGAHRAVALGADRTAAHDHHVGQGPQEGQEPAVGGAAEALGQPAPGRGAVRRGHHVGPQPGSVAGRCLGVGIGLGELDGAVRFEYAHDNQSDIWLHHILRLDDCVRLIKSRFSRKTWRCNRGKGAALEIAALVMWVLTAAAGLRPLVRWLSDGGPRRQGTKVTRYPATLVLGHPALALLALAAWVAFLLTERTVYAWSAFGALVLVTLLGFLMFTRWLTGAGGKHARGGDQGFPAVAVVAHGTVATLTFVLVLFTAITVSR